MSVPINHKDKDLFGHYIFKCFFYNPYVHQLREGINVVQSMNHPMRGKRGIVVGSCIVKN